MDIWNVDPGSNRWGVRTGVFLVTEEWLRTVKMEHLILNVTISHEGNEEDRVCYPDGTPYIDPFGFYIYTTSTIGHVLQKRRDTDLRYELRKELPRELYGEGQPDSVPDLTF